MKSESQSSDKNLSILKQKLEEREKEMKALWDSLKDGTFKK